MSLSLNITDTHQFELFLHLVSWKAADILSLVGAFYIAVRLAILAIILSAPLIAVMLVIERSMCDIRRSSGSSFLQELRFIPQAQYAKEK